MDPMGYYINYKFGIFGCRLNGSVTHTTQMFIPKTTSKNPNSAPVWGFYGFNQWFLCAEVFYVHLSSGKLTLLWTVFIVYM